MALFLQAYNITNDDPILFWTFMAQVLSGLGYDEPKYHLPYYFVYTIAFLLVLVASILRPLCAWRPTFTPMSVALAGTDHFYSCRNAKQDLGYKPEVPMQRAIAETIESFDHLKKTD